MAVILKNLTAEIISKEVAKSGIHKRVSHKEVIIPGLAAALSKKTRCVRDAPHRVFSYSTAHLSSRWGKAIEEGILVCLVQENQDSQV